MIGNGCSARATHPGAYGEVIDTGLMFVVELGSRADRFLDEEG